MLRRKTETAEEQIVRSRCYQQNIGTLCKEFFVMCHNIGYSNLSTIYREHVVLKETDRLAIGDLGISLFFGTELSRTFCAQ